MIINYGRQIGISNEILLFPCSPDIQTCIKLVYYVCKYSLFVELSKILTDIASVCLCMLRVCMHVSMCICVCLCEQRQLKHLKQGQLYVAIFKHC